MIKHVIQLIILVSFVGSASGQFEGKIVYKQTYLSNDPELTSEALSEFLGDTHEYYTDGVNYASLLNGMAKSKSVYFPSSKEIIRYYPNGDSVITVDVRNPDSELREAKLTNEKETILSWDCKSMIMNTSVAKQTYYYADELEVKSKAYKSHQYGNWDTYTKLTEALPLKYVMVFPEFTMIGTAVSVEEMDLSDSFFDEIIPTYKRPNNNECEANEWVGKWYGDLAFSDGSTMLAVLEISEVKNCKVSGAIHYPSYYNSKYNLSGTIKGDSIFLSEKEIIQGIINQSKGDFLLKMSEKDLVGDAQINGNFNASVRMRRSSEFSDADITAKENAIVEYAIKYGSMSIGNKSKIEGKELLEKVASLLKESDVVDFQNIRLTGSMTMAKLTFPVKMILSNSNQLYTEFEIQSQFFKIGNDGVVKWEYNPFEDVLQIDSVEEDAPDGNSLSKFTGSLGETLEDGFMINEVRDAKLDSIEVYRFLLANAEEVRAFYISKDSESLVRQEIKGEVELFFNYKWFDQLYLPSIYFKLDGKQDGRFDFEEVVLDSDVDENIYNIPNELRHKIRTKKSARDYYEEGIKFYNDGQYQQAKEQYDEAISLNSSRSSYFYERARTHLALNDYYSAVSDAQKAIELNPNNAKYYNTLGLAKYYLEDYKNSLKDFSASIKRDSTFGLAYYHKGLSFYRSGLKDSSFVYMSLATKHDESKSYIFLNHGIIGNEVGEYELARKSLKKAVSMGADTASTYNRIAVGFYGLGNYDSAKVYMNKVLELDPENLLYRKNMGQTLYNLGAFEDAALILEDVVNKDAEDHSAFNFLGLCYYYMNDFDGAIYYYDKAISLSRDAVYFDNRAYAKIGVDKYSEAIEDFTRSIEIYPDDSEVFYQRGLLHELQHNQFDACKDFKRAIDIGHEEAESKFKEVCN